MQGKKINRITLKLLKTVYFSVGNRRGWNFSRMKTESETAPWNYLEIVQKYLKPRQYVLDIGTGGGEKFLMLSKYFSKGVGIDVDEDMIRTAKENTKRSKNTNISFREMGAEKIKYPKNTFDIVLNRHAVLAPKEVARVLKPGGYFITQQVPNDNMQNLKKILGYKKTWRNETSFLSQEFQKYGCNTIATGKYNIRYWVKDISSLVFWLKAVNMPENFSIREHGAALLKFMKQYKTSKGYITNESRSFLIVRKNKRKG